MSDVYTDALNLIEGAGAARPPKWMAGVTRTPRRLKRGRKVARPATVHVYPRSTSNLKLGR